MAAGRSPRIAVVIPAYNHATYIAEAIRSVAIQDWPDLELHILDDGSQDDTAAVAGNALDRVNGMRCHLSTQANAGSAVTLNRLIAGTDADFVAILNSDDYYLPGRLQTMMEFANEDPFVAFSGVAFDAGAMASPEIGFEDWYQGKLAYALSLPSCGYALLTANLAISSGNFLFSRRLFDDVGGFNKELPLTQDWEFLLKALRWTEPRLIPQKLLYYRVHETNSFRQLFDVRIEQSKQALAGFLEWSDLPTANRFAPTPMTWQRFFPIFARSCTPAFSMDTIGNFLPEKLLTVNSSDARCAALEDIALSNMLGAAKARQQNLLKSTDVLLTDVATQWAMMRNMLGENVG